jgi:hypothetical protein
MAHSTVRRQKVFGSLQMPLEIFPVQMASSLKTPSFRSSRILALMRFHGFHTQAKRVEAWAWTYRRHQNLRCRMEKAGFFA